MQWMRAVFHDGSEFGRHPPPPLSPVNSPELELLGQTTAQRRAEATIKSPELRSAHSKGPRPPQKMEVSLTLLIKVTRVMGLVQLIAQVNILVLEFPGCSF